MWSNIAQLRSSLPKKQIIKSSNQQRSDRRKSTNKCSYGFMALEMTISWSLDIFMRHNSWNDSRQTALHMLEHAPRFQTQVVVRWIGFLVGSRFKMATLEIRLKRVNKIYFEGVSGFLQTLTEFVHVVKELGFHRPGSVIAICILRHVVNVSFCFWYFQFCFKILRLTLQIQIQRMKEEGWKWYLSTIMTSFLSLHTARIQRAWMLPFECCILGYKGPLHFVIGPPLLKGGISKGEGRGL